MVWAYYKNGYRKDSGVKMNCSKKDRQREVKIGG
jgi:hypothetical protein